MNPYTPGPNRARILELNAQGITGRQIGLQLGISTQRVNGILAEHGRSATTKRAERRAQVAALDAQGLAGSTISKQLKIGKAKVRHDLGVLGICRARERVEKRRDEVRRLSNEGVSPTNIAKEIGVSLSTVVSDRSVMKLWTRRRA